jgi:hypothetical protein
VLFYLKDKVWEAKRRACCSNRTVSLFEGDGNIKYNNGNLAGDPKLAINYFLHALEKIPSLIEKYQADTEKISKDGMRIQFFVNYIFTNLITFTKRILTGE